MKFIELTIFFLAIEIGITILLSPLFFSIWLGSCIYLVFLFFSWIPLIIIFRIIIGLANKFL